ncbi:MAG: hypothetical protein WC914_06165 [Proteiniphilum sp.]
MLKRFDFSFDEVLSSVKELSDDNADGFSIAEMAESLGMGDNWCRQKIRALIKAGKVICAGKKMSTTIDGRTCRVPVYRVVK